MIALIWFLWGFKPDCSYSQRSFKIWNFKILMKFLGWFTTLWASNFRVRQSWKTPVPDKAFCLFSNSRTCLLCYGVRLWWRSHDAHTQRHFPRAQINVSFYIFWYNFWLFTFLVSCTVCTSLYQNVHFCTTVYIFTLAYILYSRVKCV